MLCYTRMGGIVTVRAGMKDIAGAKGITVKHCRFENIGTAVHSDWSGSSGFYIADNDMLGREDLNSFFTWFAIKPWIDRPDYEERSRVTPGTLHPLKKNGISIRRIVMRSRTHRFRLHGGFSKRCKLMPRQQDRIITAYLWTTTFSSTHRCRILPIQLMSWRLIRLICDSGKARQPSTQA
jgi:hypothetical protein